MHSRAPTKSLVSKKDFLPQEDCYVSLPLRRGSSGKWHVPECEPGLKFAGIFNSNCNAKACRLTCHYDGGAADSYAISDNECVLVKKPKYVTFDTFGWCYALF